MIIKTNPLTQYPDVERIKDEIVKSFGRDLGELFLKNVRDIYDDLSALEKTERVTSFPTANLAHRGKVILLEGTGGGADGLFICADTGGAGYSWKTIALT